MEKYLTRDEFELYVVGKTILKLDFNDITFTDGSKIEIERSDFYGDDFKLTIPQ